MTPEPIDTPDAAAEPQPEPAPQSGEANHNEAPPAKMGEAEMRDRFNLAKFALAGVPPLTLVQMATNMLIAGGGQPGRMLAGKINFVIGNFLAEMQRQAAPKIIMPGGPPAAPRGLRPKGQ